MGTANASLSRRTEPPPPAPDADSVPQTPRLIEGSDLSPPPPRPIITSGTHLMTEGPTTQASEHILAMQSSFDSYMNVRSDLLRDERGLATSILVQTLQAVGLPPPPEASADKSRIDSGLQKRLSELARRTRCSLPDMVKLLRGESVDDPRPNKALLPLMKPVNPQSELWDSIVRNGVVPPLSSEPPRQLAPPPNHASARAHLADVRKLLRKGQEQNRFLILDMDLLGQWPEVFCSPLGVVTSEDDPSKARLIHDLSYPVGGSLNSLTDASRLPPLSYDGHKAIARRILGLRSKYPGYPVLIATGDVSGAFRHIPIAADHVRLFAATLPEDNALIIDTSCPFGWSGSPAFYHVAASQITGLYGLAGTTWLRQPNGFQGQFYPLVWVDDHVCIEVDVGTRTGEAAICLRQAMVAVLGPEAINEDKFRQFSTVCRALGLDWDTTTNEPTVSVPVQKIAKGVRRIQEVLETRLVPPRLIHRLTGTLRYLSTCVTPAKPHISSLRPLTAHTSRNRRALSSEHKDDLRWCLLILKTAGLNQIPLAELLHSAEPKVHIFMDASDFGLCALSPQSCSFLQRPFSEAESALIRDRDPEWHINIRELLNVLLASLAWAQAEWAPLSTERRSVHVCCWIDNSSAVSWVTSRQCPVSTGRCILRVVSLLEAILGIRISARHIPGELNAVADAGSRVWSAPSFAATFANACSSWSQVQIEDTWMRPLTLWRTISEQNHSAAQLRGPTGAHGPSGVRGATASTSQSGSLGDETARRLLSLAASLLTAPPSASTAQDGEIPVAQSA